MCRKYLHEVSYWKWDKHDLPNDCFSCFNISFSKKSCRELKGNENVNMTAQTDTKD